MDLFDLATGAHIGVYTGHFFIPDSAVAAEITTDLAGVDRRYLKYDMSTAAVAIDTADDPSVAVVGGVIVPSLEGMKAALRGTLMAACRAAITAGVTCDALGAGYRYPTAILDQQNLASQVLAALVDGDTGVYMFWCADRAGKWGRSAHSAKQIIAVGRAVRAHVTACQDHYAALVAVLDDPTTDTAAKVAAIGW